MIARRRNLVPQLAASDTPRKVTRKNLGGASGCGGRRRSLSASPLSDSLSDFGHGVDTKHIPLMFRRLRGIPPA
jgi:hypothetical protein